MSLDELEHYRESVKRLLNEVTQLFRAVQSPHWGKRYRNHWPIDADGQTIRGEGVNGYTFKPFQVPVPPELVIMCKADMPKLNVFDATCWTAGEAAQRLYEQLTDYVPRGLAKIAGKGPGRPAKKTKAKRPKSGNGPRRTSPADENVVEREIASSRWNLLKVMENHKVIALIPSLLDRVEQECAKARLLRPESPTAGKAGTGADPLGAAKPPPAGDRAAFIFGENDGRILYACEKAGRALIYVELTVRAKLSENTCEGRVPKLLENGYLVRNGERGGVAITTKGKTALQKMLDAGDDFEN